REGIWIIAVAETVINPVFAEKRLNNVPAKKTQEVPCFKTELFEAPKILESFMFGLRKRGYYPSSPTQ
ncbi:MAG: hypothetical protein ACXU99_06025, partial [Thermodesulfobacteriota bacterium]